MTRELLNALGAAQVEKTPVGNGLPDVPQELPTEEMLPPEGEPLPAASEADGGAKPPLPKGGCPSPQTGAGGYTTTPVTVTAPAPARPDCGERRESIPQSRFAVSQPPLGKGAKAEGEQEEGGSRAELLPQGGGEAVRASSDAAAIRAHFDALCAQAPALEAEFPDFSLAAALRDADFVRLTAPGMGVEPRRAWLALHPESLRRRAAEESAAALARSLASGASRPREGGGQTGAALRTDYRSLPRSEQLRLKQRIYNAAALGEKIYP